MAGAVIVLIRFKIFVVAAELSADHDSAIRAPS
jgi:hypothetical protein